MTAISREPLPWRGIVALAIAAAVVCTVYPASVVRDGAVVDLLLASSDTRAGTPVQKDFPDEQLQSGFGHDGQYFYVIARQPLDPEAAAEGLDRPRYRLQRILLPLAGWLLHPRPGPGLVVALVAVGLLAVWLGTIATAALLHALGGRWRHAWLFAALPGTYWSLRLTTADTLALALASAAVALSLRNRALPATVLGVAAVLAKEPIWLVLVGVAFWRRDKQGAALALVPAAVAGAWLVLLRLIVPDNSQSVFGLTWPLEGFLQAWRLGWSRGVALSGLVVAVAALGVGCAALVRHGLRWPLGWPILLHLGMIACTNEDVVGLPDNNSRTMGALLLFGVIGLLVPRCTEGNDIEIDGRAPATPEHSR